MTSSLVDVSRRYFTSGELPCVTVTTPYWQICWPVVCHIVCPGRNVPWHPGDPNCNWKNLGLCPGKVRAVGNLSRQVDHSGNMHQKILRLCPGNAQQVGGWSRREVVRSLVGGDAGTTRTGKNTFSQNVPG